MRSRWLAAAGAIALALALAWPAPAAIARRPAAVPIASWGLASPGPAVDSRSAAASQVAAPAAPPDISAEATLNLLGAVAIPARDEADLVRRFKKGCGEPVAPPISLAPAGRVGEHRTFWIFDEPARRYFEAAATLRHTSEHLALYVQDGVNVAPAALTAAADTFEQRTYPVLVRYFGDLPPGMRVNIFNGHVPGVGGYFSAPDLFSREVNPFSNELPVVYVNTNQLRPGTAFYDAVLAHEVQHLIHALVHPYQDAWVNEGASEVAMAVAGFGDSEIVGAAFAFLSAPETQLNTWVDSAALGRPHYGAAYLFLEYFAQRLGGYDALRELIATPGQGLRLFERYLAQRPDAPPLDDLFRDWVIANLLNDPSLAGGHYGYQRAPGAADARRPARVQPQQRLGPFPATSTGRVAQYATRYVEVVPPPGAAAATLELAFSGTPEVPLVGGEPVSGRALWWGNSADSMESTLTRELDLTEVGAATLRFWTWFDVERDFDYAGVAVSEDGGCTWRGLAGVHTTAEDPLGHNVFGHAYTGRSGGGDIARWVDEEMDLTPFAGRRILLRFFYATDQGYYGPGFAVDDASVPEIGFFDDAEDDRGWDARGFLRGANALPQRWAVQVVASGPGLPGGTEVFQLPLGRVLNEDGTRAVEGRLAIPGFGGAVTRVVVAISPLAPATQERATYHLQAALGS